MIYTLTFPELLELTEQRADYWWKEIRKQYPSRVAKTPPVVYNNRLKTLAGRAWLERQFVELSTELTLEHPIEQLEETLPHEFAHLVAYVVYNDKGHQTGWKTVMRSIGKNPNRCHYMINTLHEQRKQARIAA